MTRKEQLMEQYSNWLKMRNYSVQTYKAYLQILEILPAAQQRHPDVPSFQIWHEIEHVSET